MKFAYAWADVSSQNVTLKVVVLALSLCLVVLGVSVSSLAFKDPLVVERSCYSKAISPANAERSVSEIESFAKEAISIRFNSDVITGLSFLSSEEISNRNQEQKELSSRSMSQKVLVNSIKINGNQITIDADRLISVGQVRSAFSFPILLSIAPEKRTEANPYGLVVTRVTQPKTEETSAKK